MDKRIELRRDFNETWEVPFDKIQWFGHAPDHDRSTLLEIADGNTDFLRINFPVNSRETCDITSDLTGEAPTLVNTKDLLDPFYPAA